MTQAYSLLKVLMCFWVLIMFRAFWSWLTKRSGITTSTCKPTRYDLVTLDYVPFTSIETIIEDVEQVLIERDEVCVVGVDLKFTEMKDPSCLQKLVSRRETDGFVFGDLLSTTQSESEELRLFTAGKIFLRCSLKQ